MKQLLLSLVVVLGVSSVVYPAPSDLGEIRNILKEQTINEMTFEDESIATVLLAMQSVTNIDIVVTDKLKESDITITLDITSEISVLELLKMMETTKGVRFWYEDGIIYAYPKEERVQKAIVQTYHVGSLEVPRRDFPGPQIELSADGQDSSPIMMDVGGGEEERDIVLEDLPDLIQEYTGQSSGQESYWEDDKAVCEIKGDMLIVRAIPSVHREIADLLDKLQQ